MPWVLGSLPHHCADPGCPLARPQARAGSRVGPGLPEHGSASPPAVSVPGGWSCAGLSSPRGPRWSGAWGKSPWSEAPLPTAPSTWQEGTTEFCFSRLVSCRVHKRFYVSGDTANSSSGKKHPFSYFNCDLDFGQNP